MKEETKKSYISLKARKKKSRFGGDGLFATVKIFKGEHVVDYTDGPGRLLSLKEANSFYHKGSDYMIQTGDDRFFIATNTDELEDADFINHSCDPNCGIRGSLEIVAMRDIEPGEEITIDYAMSESSDLHMECSCSSA